MIELGSQVQSVKQCIALRGAVDDERCWRSLQQLEHVLTSAEHQAQALNDYLTNEGWQ